MSTIKIETMLEGNLKDIEFVRRYAEATENHQLEKRANEKHLEHWLKNVFLSKLKTYDLKEELLSKWKNDLK